MTPAVSVRYPNGSAAFGLTTLVRVSPTVKTSIESGLKTVKYGGARFIFDESTTSRQGRQKMDCQTR